MEEQKKGTFRNFIEENSKAICGAGLVLTGCFIGAAVGRQMTVLKIGGSLQTLFAENPELKKSFTETLSNTLKKN